MTGLTPRLCPHCLADFARDLVEIKTSNPPKCGRCLLPLWWEDRSGRVPDKPYPSYTLALAAQEYLSAQAALAAAGVTPERPVAAKRLADAWVVLNKVFK